MEFTATFRRQEEFWTSVLERIEWCALRILRSADMARENDKLQGPVPQRATDLERSREMLAALAEAKVRARRGEGAIRSLRMSAGQEENQSFLQLYEQVLKELRTEIPDADPRSDKHYKRLMEYVAALQGPGNFTDDVQIETSATPRSTKCPVTGLEMLDAVRNQTCGHSYSRDGIEQHIRTMNGKAHVTPTMEARCPVAGCPEIVSTATLERDFEIEVIRRERARRDANTPSQPSGDVTNLV